MTFKNNELIIKQGDAAFMVPALNGGAGTHPPPEPATINTKGKLVLKIN